MTRNLKIYNENGELVEKTFEKLPYPSRNQKKKEICSFWFLRSCKSGEACPFLHEGEQVKYPELCKFFKSGESFCHKDDCPYSHDLSTVACKYMVENGICRYASNCRFSHDEALIKSSKKESILQSEMKPNLSPATKLNTQEQSLDESETSLPSKPEILHPGRLCIDFG